MMEMFWAGEDEVEELEVDEGREKVNMLLQAAERKKRGDFWTVDRARNTITKHHVRKRKSLYSPLHDHSLPVPLSSLSQEQTTQMHFCRTDLRARRLTNGLRQVLPPLRRPGGPVPLPSPS